MPSKGKQDGGDDKEQKRLKAYKKVKKVLSKAWQLEGADVFQEGGSWSLNQVVQNIEQHQYNGGPKHIWQSFASELGSVYTTHIAGYVLQK